MLSFRKAVWETMPAQIPQIDKDSNNAIPAGRFWRGLKRVEIWEEEELLGRDCGCWSLADSCHGVKGQDHCPRSQGGRSTEQQKSVRRPWSIKQAFLLRGEGGVGVGSQICPRIHLLEKNGITSFTCVAYTSLKVFKLARAWWRTPLILPLRGRGRQSLWILNWGHSGLYRELQNSKGYRKRPWLKNKNHHHHHLCLLWQLKSPWL